MNIDTRIKYRQPAMSKTLKELEALLTVSLFVRSKSGISLTEAGVAFLRYATPSVQALREGVNALRGGEYAGGTVRLGVLSTVESVLIPELVSRLHRQHSSLVVSVVTGPSAYLLSQLRVGDVDLVVGRMTDSPEIQGMNFEHLYSECMTLVVRAGHPLTLHPLDRSLLEHYPLVVPLANTTIRAYADSLFVQCGINPSSQRLETLSVTLSRRYVLCNDAVWIAPLDAVRMDLASGEFHELDLGQREPGGSIGICRNAHVPVSLAVQGCIEVLRELGQAYAKGVYP